MGWSIGSGWGRGWSATSSGGGGGSTNTFNPADKSASITLSGGNLVAAQGAAGTYSAVRAVDSTSTAKRCWEFVYTTMAGYISPGFANSTFPLDANRLGTENNGVGIIGGFPNIYLNNVVLGPIAAAAPVTGDTVRFAVDFTAQKVWAQVNGGNWNNATLASQDPANGIGGYSFSTMAAGPYYAAVTMFQNETVTANFSPNSPPSGFSDWP